jgi:hypothetical protein
MRGMAYSMQQCMVLVSGMDSAISAAAVHAAPGFSHRRAQCAAVS